MALKYTFSIEEIREIEQARKKNKNKRVETRLKVLAMRAKGAKAKGIAEATGFHASNISRLVAKYKQGGLEAIVGNHYGGNHRNISFEEEAAILEPFKKQAESGKLVELSEIDKAYRAAVGHPVADTQIYRVLQRHSWRKVMPRSRHPQKADEETIAASKKLTPQ